jgi:hypothetical protein
MDETMWGIGFVRCRVVLSAGECFVNSYGNGCPMRRTQMNGLDFDHRVLQPWVTNPAFYVTVFSGRSDQPAREGPHADESLELWRYTFPLSIADANEVRARLRAIPGLLTQAKRNLIGNARDLWTMGLGSMRDQAAALETLAGRVPVTRSYLPTSIAHERPPLTW